MIVLLHIPFFTYSNQLGLTRNDFVTSDTHVDSA